MRLDGKTYAGICMHDMLDHMDTTDGKRSGPDAGQSWLVGLICCATGLDLVMTRLVGGRYCC